MGYSADMVQGDPFTSEQLTDLDLEEQFDEYGICEGCLKMGCLNIYNACENCHDTTDITTFDSGTNNVGVTNIATKHIHSYICVTTLKDIDSDGYKDRSIEVVYQIKS